MRYVSMSACNCFYDNVTVRICSSYYFAKWTRFRVSEPMAPTILFPKFYVARVSMSMTV